MTYQLLDSVEEDKVYHGIKIRMILNIALFESLAERPAWRNLQKFNFCALSSATARGSEERKVDCLRSTTLLFTNLQSGNQCQKQPSIIWLRHVK